MKKTLVIALLSLSTWAFSQTTASLSGKVADAGTGETLAGASIFVEGMNKQLTTDLNGYFDLSSIQPGTYTLVCQYLSYSDKKLRVEIKGGEIAFVRIDLQETGTDLTDGVSIGTVQLNNSSPSH